MADSSYQRKRIDRSIEEESEEEGSDYSTDQTKGFENKILPKKGKNFPVLRSNKKGLPIEVQRIILHCVLHCNGNDNFSRDYCDKNPDHLGERNSARRAACRAKRRHFLRIRSEHPQAFIALCDKFGLAIPSEDSLLKTINKFETPGTPTTTPATSVPPSSPESLISFVSPPLWHSEKKKAYSKMALQLFGKFLILDYILLLATSYFS